MERLMENVFIKILTAIGKLDNWTEKKCYDPWIHSSSYLLKIITFPLLTLLAVSLNIASYIYEAFFYLAGSLRCPLCNKKLQVFYNYGYLYFKCLKLTKNSNYHFERIWGKYNNSKYYRFDDFTIHHILDENKIACMPYGNASIPSIRIPHSIFNKWQIKDIENNIKKYLILS